jgi:hypothetical protein
MAAFVLTAITSDPELAAEADKAGVDRIGVDIERLDKNARQGHLPDARISDHELSDLDRLAVRESRAALFARLNPLHPGSREEVEEAPALTRAARILGGVTGSRASRPARRASSASALLDPQPSSKPSIACKQT